MVNEHAKNDLYDGIVSVRTRQEAINFLRDLLTIAELKEFANRFQAAKLLSQGQSYLAVSKKLKMSTTTVTRVSHWLHHGMGGYKLILFRLFKIKGK